MTRQSVGNPIELGYRLRAAIGARSVRSFSMAMLSRGTRGHSRQMIQNYLSGKLLPPLGFIYDAASELGVSSAWLAFGDGDMAAVDGGPGPTIVARLRLIAHELEAKK